jgi:hypothetical protein
MPRAPKRKLDETMGRAEELAGLVEQLQGSIQKQHEIQREKEQDRDALLEQYEALVKEREGMQGIAAAKDAEKEHETLRKSVKGKIERVWGGSA